MEMDTIQFGFENCSVELMDVDVDEIPDGPVSSYQQEINQCHQRTEIASGCIEPSSVHQVPNEKVNVTQSQPIVNGKLTKKGFLLSLQSFFFSSDQVPVDKVKLSDIAGQRDWFRSQGETHISLSSFGLSNVTMTGESSSRKAKLVEKIRRDVKQLGLLCAAGSESDKEQLVNVLIINQQLNIIDPPPVDELEPSDEPRTIKSILKPPTVPQRVKPKRNMNLKISYGVVTAEEVVQSLLEREAADRQHKIEREADDIAKIARENEIATLEEELKHLRKFVSDARSENAAKNKEIIQKKKAKSIESTELMLEEAGKEERENLIKQYDGQLRELRERMKELKSVHVATNKDVLLKRKAFEMRKKEVGNKVQPSNAPPEIDDSELDSESC